jgi:hypothetical protein
VFVPVLLNDVLALPEEERVAPLLAYANAGTNGSDAGELIGALLALLDAGAGAADQRLAIGELLARFGDPRLRAPSDTDYFVPVAVHQEILLVGRFPVTMAEFGAFVDTGAYDDDANWSAEGLAWKAESNDTWPVRYPKLDGCLTVANQPAVSVNWFEAQAYAKASGARLPSQMERLHVMRGEAKRPYPWGAPFGSGNANTAEEVLKRPCAVGLYHRDATPEGVMDLAGNVAEWLGDDVAPKRIIHPGAWSQPSMAAWAKARFLIEPDFRGPDLGFRLVRDA